MMPSFSRHHVALITFTEKTSSSSGSSDTPNHQHEKKCFS